MQTNTAERDADFVAFVRNAQSRLRRVAYLMCGDWHRAEDVVQAALVKLYRQWPRVALREHLSAASVGAHPTTHSPTRETP